MQYKDLSDSAKDRAFNYFQEYNIGDDFDSRVDATYTHYRDMLEDRGLYDLVFEYCGFGNQGDGACFTCSIDLKSFLEAHQEIRNYHGRLYTALIPFDEKGAACIYYDIQITKIGGATTSYSHEKTVHLGYWDMDVHTVHILADEEEDYGRLFRDAEGDIEEQCRYYMRQLYRDLEAEFEYTTSLEAFLGEVEFQDFDKDGGLI